MEEQLLEAYPENFDLKAFSEIKTFKDRIAYCKERLKQLGNGSSRIAYVVDDEKVLKIAKNMKGIAQNEVECDWSRNNYGCFATVFNADTESYKWLEMELCRKARESDFQNLIGIPMIDVFNVIISMYNEYAPNGKRKQYYGGMADEEKVKENKERLVYNEGSDTLFSLYCYMSDYLADNSFVSDLMAKMNWGVASRNGKNELVIIDAGLTDEVWNKHYKKW